jgi:hypothetical protein
MKQIVNSFRRLCFLNEVPDRMSFMQIFNNQLPIKTANCPTANCLLNYFFWWQSHKPKNHNLHPLCETLHVLCETLWNNIQDHSTELHREGTEFDLCLFCETP